MSHVDGLSLICFFFKQKTAYEMRISDWSSDVCSSDLIACGPAPALRRERQARFDDRGIADKPREAAEVRGSIEDIGITGARIGGEPALHQRRLRGDRKEDGTDRRGEQPRHPQDRKSAVEGTGM